MTPTLFSLTPRKIIFETIFQVTKNWRQKWPISRYCPNGHSKFEHKSVKKVKMKKGAHFGTLFFGPKGHFLNFTLDQKYPTFW
jgi:hypothetical protein